MTEYADPELSLHSRENDIYAAEIRVSQPRSETDIRLAQDAPINVQLDLNDLKSKSTDIIAYASSLTRGLFADPKPASEQARARAYLEDYFRNASVSTSWEQSLDLLRELNQQWKKAGKTL